MIHEVKTCIDAKVNFFSEYFIAPDSIHEELESFIQDTKTLGESCSTANEFESRFASEGLADRFGALIPKCVPKAHQMTREEKQQSVQIAKDIIVENKDEIIKDTVTGVATDIRTDLRSEVIKENRERMIDNGTFGDYTRASNAVEDIGSIAKFFKNKFKK